MQLHPDVIVGLDKFLARFTNKAFSAIDQIVALSDRFPIVLVALYGSILRGPSPHSDIDILVLYDSEAISYKMQYLEMRDAIMEISDSFEECFPTLDIQVFSFTNFIDTTKATEFKRGFSANNRVMWTKEGFLESRGFV